MRRINIRAGIKKYRNIGNLGIGSGRRAVIRAVRELRDQD